ncbi:MAG: magnesium transporter [Desulfurococcales archaeon]|nr:magnesium transporter [Desulfurococcales archaeon]
MAEISGGLLTANAGDALNSFLLGFFLPYLLKNPVLIALLPVMAAVRGSIMTSMASRLTTALHLGAAEPRIGELLGRETGRTLTLALASSLYVGILVSFMTLYSPYQTVSTAAYSALLALLFLLPVTVLVIVVGFRYNLNPDNYVAPVLTVLGDVSTVPSLVAVSLVIEGRADVELLLAVTAAYIGLSSLLYYALTGGESRRVVGEGLLSLILVGLIESGTGGLYDRFTAALVGLAVIHIVPSLMEDIGASLSVLASRMTTDLYLSGFEYAVKRSLVGLTEVVLGSLASMVVLSTIGVAAGSVAGFDVGLAYMFKVIAFSWLGLLALLIPLVLLLVWVSVRIGLDPDNIVIPLITSIVDLSVIPFLVFIVAPLLAG